MRITALDLSLTATGYAIGGLRNPKEASGVVEPNGSRGFERLDYLRSKMLELVHGSDLVVLEGYGFTGGRGHAPMQMGELGGIARMTLYDLGFLWVDIAPASLKKLATGRGNAAKEEVLVAAVRRLEYDGSNHNEADALWLLEAAMTHYNIVAPVVPKSHLVALEKIEWPVVP